MSFRMNLYEIIFIATAREASAAKGGVIPGPDRISMHIPHDSKTITIRPNNNEIRRYHVSFRDISYFIAHSGRA